MFLKIVHKQMFIVFSLTFPFYVSFPFYLISFMINLPIPFNSFMNSQNQNVTARFFFLFFGFQFVQPVKLLLLNK